MASVWQRCGLTLLVREWCEGGYRVVVRCSILLSLNIKIMILTKKVVKTDVKNNLKHQVAALVSVEAVVPGARDT